MLDTLPSWAANRDIVDYFLFTTAPCVSVAKSFLRSLGIGSNVFVVEHFGPDNLGLLDFMRERVHALTSTITGLTVEQVWLKYHLQ